MIDTHAHILPGIDDGARDLSESLEFIRLAASQGVETIFATPHFCDGVFNCTKKQVLQTCDELNECLEEQGIAIQVLPGAEVRINHDLVVEYDNDSLLTLNNGHTHLLIELPTMFMTPAIAMMIRQLKDRGVTPIIAHAERNPMILTKPEIVDKFVFSGAVIQVTAGSLTGDFGRHALKASRSLISMGKVFCIGSDIHPGRKYRMADAKKRMVKLLGKKEANMILIENPRQLFEQVQPQNTSLFKEVYIF